MKTSAATLKGIPKPVRRQRHDVVVVIKLARSLVYVIDQDAEAEGLTRSAIIRRVLKKKYESDSVTTS